MQTCATCIIGGVFEVQLQFNTTRPLGASGRGKREREREMIAAVPASKNYQIPFALAVKAESGKVNWRLAKCLRATGNENKKMLWGVK
jgi:hypothetical protein